MKSNYLKFVSKPFENLYFKKESIKHKYPFCWRTDTPLIYLAQNSWFLNVQKIKDDLIKFFKLLSTSQSELWQF